MGRIGVEVSDKVIEKAFQQEFKLSLCSIKLQEM